MTQTKRTKINPDYNTKPAVVDYFEKYPKAKQLTETTVDYILKHYDKDAAHYGYQNKTPNLFKLNAYKADGNTIRITVAQQHITLRFNVDGIVVNKDKFTIHHYKGRTTNDNRKGVDFKIESEIDLNKVDDFLASTSIPNINYNKNALPAKFPDTPTKSYTVRTGSIETKVHGWEALLTEKFDQWLTKESATKIKHEVPTDNTETKDRIDMEFTLGDKRVIAELKSIRGGRVKAKYCIRQALGQILDYKYYPKGKKSDELWIVLDGAVNPDDQKFIKTINKKFLKKLYVYALDESHEFKRYPKE